MNVSLYFAARWSCSAILSPAAAFAGLVCSEGAAGAAGAAGTAGATGATGATGAAGAGVVAGIAGAAGAGTGAGAISGTGATAEAGGGETSLLEFRSFPQLRAGRGAAFTWPGIACVRGAGPPIEAAVDF